MIHPVYKGALLNSEQMEATLTWLLKIKPNFLRFAIAFEADYSVYPKSFFLAQDIPTMVWWKGLENPNIPSEFIQLMVHLHST